MAKKGTKFPPNSRVAVLNDLEGNDESPLVIHTDQNGEIENMAIDELRVDE